MVVITGEVLFDRTGPFVVVDYGAADAGTSMDLIRGAVGNNAKE